MPWFLYAKHAIKIVLLVAKLIWQAKRMRLYFIWKSQIGIVHVIMLIYNTKRVRFNVKLLLPAAMCHVAITVQSSGAPFEPPRRKLPPFSLIRDFGKQNTRGNVSKIAVNLTCYRQIGSKSTNHSPLAWGREGQDVTLVAVICGFRSDLSITRKTDGNFGNVSSSVLFSKVAYQRKRW